MKISKGFYVSTLLKLGYGKISMKTGSKRLKTEEGYEEIKELEPWSVVCREE